MPRSEPYLVVTTREAEDDEAEEAESVWLRWEVAKEAAEVMVMGEVVKKEEIRRMRVIRHWS